MGWAVNLFKNNPSYERQAGGINTVTMPAFRTAYVGHTQNTDVYAQHDRALEHGYAGEQYKNGKKAGGILNYEC